jgi:hypothetical protein
MKQLFAFLVSIIWLGLLSCAHFANDPSTSVWAGGLWILPLLIAIGFFVFAYKAYKAYTGGTVEGGGSLKGPTRDVNGKPPMKNNGALWFAVILFVAFWVVVYVVNHGR